MQGFVRERSVLLSVRLSKKLESSQEESMSGVGNANARMEGVRARAAMRSTMGFLAVMLGEIGLQKQKLYSSCKSYYCC